jgi:hypothetical protein
MNYRTRRSPPTSKSSLCRTRETRPAYAEAFRCWPEVAVFGGRIRPRYEAPVEKWVIESEAALGRRAINSTKPSIAPSTKSSAVACCRSIEQWRKLRPAIAGIQGLCPSIASAHAEHELAHRPGENQSQDKADPPSRPYRAHSCPRRSVSGQPGVFPIATGH